MSGAMVGSSGLDIGVYGARGVPSTYSGYETFLTTLLPELVRRGDRATKYCRPGDGMLQADAGRHAAIAAHHFECGMARGGDRVGIRQRGRGGCRLRQRAP